MPIVLFNNYVGSKTEPLTLARLQELQRAGYSVMKTPHVGNQHPCNLLCAALGFHLDMVTFTHGVRDTNFHPHLRIQGGNARSLVSPDQLTPFMRLSCGTAVEAYHQDAVKAVFGHMSAITSDVELLAGEPALAEMVLRESSAAVQRLWYRRVERDGTLVKEDFHGPYSKIANNIFRFSNGQSGWVVPNRISLIYTLIWQALSTGRDVVYALSGPDMVGYIGGLKSNLSQMYDAVRAQWPSLPEVLYVYVVPVAQCRLVTYVRQHDALDAVVDILAWYYRQPPENRRSASQAVTAVGARYPEFTRPIERADFLTQYDLAGPSDLYIPQWLTQAPLKHVAYMVQCMSKGREQAEMPT